MKAGFEIAEKVSLFSSDLYKNLLGIFSIDNIPEEIPSHHFVIANLSRKEEPGIVNDYEYI